MGFFDGLNKAVDDKIKTIARQAPDTNLVKQILDLQQKIDDGDADAGAERTLEILKAEADRRRLYY